MATAATAKYEIRLENKTKRAFRAIGRSLKKVTRAIFSMKAGFISAAGIAGLGYLIKRSMNATDEMAKMSRAVGVSVEQLQGLRHAAALGGLEATQLDKAVQKLAINMADMSRGVGLAKDVFEKHNISVKNADGSLRTVMEVMADIADVTAGMTNATEKADLAYKLFGARGAKMINLLNGGSEGMREAMEEAEKLGLVMSEKTAKGVEDANDAMTRLKGFMTSAFTRAVAELAPYIERVTEAIMAWATLKVEEGGGIGAIAKSVANQIVFASITIINAIESIGNSIIQWVNKIKEITGFERSLESINAELNLIGKNYHNWISGNWSILDKLEEKVSGAEYVTENYRQKLEALHAERAKVLAGGNVDFKFDFSAAIFSLEQMLELINEVEPTVTEAVESQKNAIEELPSAWDGVGNSFTKYKDSVVTGTQMIANLTTRILQGTEDAIVNMIMGVKTSWKDLFRAIMADIVRIYVRKALVAAIGMMGFAGGGRPPVGRPSIVGERGAEVFVPDSAGTIIPNDQLGGTNNTKAEINFNVQAIDASSFNSYLVNNRDTIESIINTSLLQNGSVRRTIQMTA